MKYYVEIAGTERLVEIHVGKNGLEVSVDGRPHPVDIAEVQGAALYSLLVDGRSHAYAARFENGEAVLYRVKPDRPPKDDHGKVKGKYLSPKGSRLHAYIPPGVNGELSDRGKPLLIVESRKRA